MDTGELSSLDLPVRCPLYSPGQNPKDYFDGGLGHVVPSIATYAPHASTSSGVSAIEMGARIFATNAAIARW